MARKKEINEAKIKEWREWNESLKQNAQLYYSELEKYLGKKSGVLVNAKSILSLHSEIEQYFRPAPPRDTRFDDLFRHVFDSTKCAFCGLPAMSHYAFTRNYQSIKFVACDICTAKYDICIDIRNMDAVLIELQKSFQRDNAS
ncbi:MAG: hypothetical protein WDM80_16030 [Limisphaerales bacterium]